MNKARSIQQQAVADRLAQQFDIDAERILFLNEEKPEEPWLPAESLLTIARRSGNFQTIDESFDQYIEPLSQVVHRATVIDREGMTYTRSGVATINEREEVDAHALAAGRAVGAALTAAGFNPLRPGAVVSLDLALPGGDVRQADEAQSRNADLRRIHAIAERKGLILPLPGGGWDRAGYRRLLMEKFGVNTAAMFDATQRASFINILDQMPDAFADEFANVA